MKIFIASFIVLYLISLYIQWLEKPIE